MILVLGDWTDEKRRESFDKATAHLVDTEKKHQIYHTKAIINIAEVLDTLPYLDYKQQIDICLHILSMCDTVYMLKGWEYNNDVHMLHDYASVNNYQIIYSKKF